MQRRSVLLITSEHLGWAGLRLALGKIDGIDVVGEAMTGAHARELAAKLKPEVIIADGRIRGEPSLPLLLRLRQDTAPHTKIILLTARIEHAEFVALNDTVISGLLLWRDLSREALPHCLAAVIANDLVVSSREIAQQFIETQCRLPSSPASIRLLPRELAVLHDLTDGRTRQEIATREHMSLRAVDRVVACLRNKLDAPTLVVLGVRASQLGLVP